MGFLKFQRHHIIKFKLVYIPFLKLYVSCICLFGFLTWALEIKLRWWALTDSLVASFVSCVILYMLSTTFLGRRIHLLKKTKSEKNIGTIHFLIVISIALATMYFIQFTVSVMSTITHVSAIEQVDERNQSRYYKIDSLFIDKARLKKYANKSHTASKGRSHLHFNLYIAVPIINKLDSLSFWLGNSYHESISNNQSIENKRLKEKDFYADATYNFDTSILKNPYYFINLNHSDIRNGYYDALAQTIFDHRINKNNLVILCPVYEKFSNRHKQSLIGFLTTVLVGQIFFLLYLLVSHLDPNCYRAWKSTVHKKVR